LAEIEEGDGVVKLEVRTASHRPGWGGTEGEIEEAMDHHHQRVQHTDAMGLYQEAPTKLICDESGEDKRA
jgi:hypothetical protein